MQDEPRETFEEIDQWSNSENRMAEIDSKRRQRKLGECRQQDDWRKRKSRSTG